MPTDDPLWYKDAVIYEVHVRSFHDATGTGSGDFRGLTHKLDYLEDLGITALWVQPFNPSPLRDDGYDIADYTDVNPTYGTLEDFKEFLDEAHRRGIRVITELVINHTSDQHPWFQRARRAAPDSPERNFYVWSDSPDRYTGVGLMFPDFESSNWAWDPVAKQYYWHRFYSHQPDLNYDNPAVWEALFPVVDFWFDLGVDGMRLDAVPYLYEREGTSCEHLPETHAFLKALRAHVDAKYPNKMFLAEANAWPEEAVKYFGEGDECHMAFHFPLMPRLFMSLLQEDSFPILDIFAQTPAIPDNAQWCLFLRNHDELTLAMVTDEERDSMFKAYARDPHAKIFLGIRHRLAPLLNNDRRRIELMNALLFSLPGTPVIYYGDEIGMGDNIYLGDRNGVRTPMQWSADRNAGFSRSNPQRLYAPVILDPEYHFETVNVEAQQNNPSSLLWWTKRLIAMRKAYRAFGRGSLEFMKTDNAKILAFVRRYESETVLVVANLSRFVQHGQLELREFAGLVPMEMNGRSAFPAIGDSPFPIALGPHGCYWFDLKPQHRQPADCDIRQPPTLRVQRHWSELVDGPGRDELELLLPDFLRARQPSLADDGIVGCRIDGSFPIPFTTGVEAYAMVVRMEFRERQPISVLLPVRLCGEAEVDRLSLAPHRSALARVSGPTPGLLVDAAAMPGHAESLLRMIVGRRRDAMAVGELAGRTYAPIDPAEGGDAPPRVDFNEDGTLTAHFGDRLLLKIYRRIDEGSHPDVEVGRFLASRKFECMLPVIGSVEHSNRGAQVHTLTALFRKLPHQGTAWQWAQHELGRYFEKVTALSDEKRETLLKESGDWEGLFAPSEDLAGQLGHFLAKLHIAVSSDAIDPAFRPEPMGASYLRSIYQTMRNQVERTLARLKLDRAELPEQHQERAELLLASRERMMEMFREVTDPRVEAKRIRCHGDCHLGIFLHAGTGILLADYAGDGAKAISERRIKRSPLRDAAALLLSFDYVLASSVHGMESGFGRAPLALREEDRRKAEPWIDLWRGKVHRELLNAYLGGMEASGLLPVNNSIRERLIRLYSLEKALHRLEHDLDDRPEWAMVPLATVTRLLAEG